MWPPFLNQCGECLLPTYKGQRDFTKGLSLQPWSLAAQPFYCKPNKSEQKETNITCPGKSRERAHGKQV
eukprot:1141352-Pelagomonas_calceolata.AAC.1